MYELKNGELQEVSGGSVANLYGAIAGYNRFDLGGTVLLGTMVSCLCTFPKIKDAEAEPEVKLMAMAISGLMSAGNIFVGYCTGVGMAYTVGKFN